jgi:DNA invertase Pin-like site-specific DNA recombinase
MFHIAGAFAELEREIIRERVKAGLANAKRRATKVGRPRALVNLQEVVSKEPHRAFQAARSPKRRASRRQR